MKNKRVVKLSLLLMLLGSVLLFASLAVGNFDLGRFQMNFFLSADC